MVEVAAELRGRSLRAVEEGGWPPWWVVGAG